MRLRATLIVSLLLLVLGVPTARADSAGEVDVDVVVAADGAVSVTQVVHFDGDGFTQTLPKRRDIDDAAYYQYEVTEVAASSGSTPADLATEETSDHIQVSARGESPITLSYTVRGATHSDDGPQGDVTVMEWPVLAGLTIPVERVAGTISGPARPHVVDCFAGPHGGVGKCALISGGTFDAPQPSFQDGPRDAGDEIVLMVAYAVAEVAPTASIGEVWTLDRAFDASPQALAAAALAALFGGAFIYWLHRRTGRDVGHSETVRPVGSFVPVGAGESVFEVPTAVRPGHVGTVADESVDPVDITATLLDLAVRGHLRITELPKPPHGLLDWQLERRPGPDDLARFERELLDAVAPAEGPCLVSELPERLDGRIERIQDALYDDVVERGWFESRPDSTRSSWRTRGWVGFGVAAVAAALLIAFTTFGIVALVLLAVAASLVLVADQMPRRTAAGSELLSGLHALSALLLTHPTNHMPAGREVDEISTLLPYTVVLGGKDRWLDAMVAADVDDSPDPDALDWYHAPDTWHLQDLPASLTQFVHTVQGELFAR
ncbi:MAG TPA: DUF2207 domain-containing protein [Tessaracoccus flavescens]|uniref:DUF2207 domain-containing protein n=1 Tax=Tessaracoccus flavescens TaxID=399497 RepID=A0A921EQ26_9ACTN|nr:DUF2207 domain-containing protein [Tessaracoccus flavescens]